MPFSHHSHSGQFCHHAEDSLEDIIQAAISKGMIVFALTEHIPRYHQEDLYPDEIKAQCTTFDLFRSFAKYYDHALQLRAKYAGQIHILVGFETEYIRTSSVSQIRDLLGQYKFDFFVGSVHHVHGIPIDLDRQTYEIAVEAAGGSEDRLVEEYLDAQHEMLQHLKPAVVGHFDVIRLFSVEPSRPLNGYGANVWEKVMRNLRLVFGYGGLVEINSASLRKGWDTPYPGKDVCKEFKKLGGRFTVSDDSHGIAQVGLNYEGVGSYIEELQLETIYFLEKLPMGEIAIDTLDACAVRAMPVNEFRNHRFWKSQ